MMTCDSTSEAAREQKTRVLSVRSELTTLNTLYPSPNTKHHGTRHALKHTHNKIQP